MGKTVPIVGIVGSVLGLLAATILVPDGGALLFPVFPLVGGVLLFPERRSIGVGIGIATIALSLVAAAGLIGSIGGKNGAIDFGIPTAAGQALLIWACVMLPLAVALGRRDTLPPWAVYTGCAAVALTVLCAFIGMDGLGDQSSPWSIVVGILSLASMAPAVVALRLPPVTERQAAPIQKP